MTLSVLRWRVLEIWLKKVGLVPVWQITHCDAWKKDETAVEAQNWNTSLQGFVDVNEAEGKVYSQQRQTPVAPAPAPGSEVAVGVGANQESFPDDQGAQHLECSQ